MIKEFILNSRRFLIKSILTGVILLGLINSPVISFAKKHIVKITILHTNDVHSRIEALPASDKNAFMGGCARRAALIKKIRSEEKNVLLFDAGDMFQGTPFFNKYDGELELKLMSEMGYNAGTIGNHEFDHGLERLSKVLKYASFPLLCSNYNFSNTPMKGKTLPYKVFTVEGVKVGVFGLGVELKGLVTSDMYGKTEYEDAAVAAARTAHTLKKELGCDFIICLSHLGLKYENDKISDMSLAKQSKYIDVIIGGHSHTLLDKPTKVRNSDNKEVIICQVGSAGARLGRLDFYFEKKTKLKLAAYNTTK